MPTEQLEAALDLSIDEAMASVEALGSAIDSTFETSADTFSEAMESAIAAIPDPELEVSADTSTVDPAITAAVDAADSTVEVDAEGTETITSDIDSAVEAAETTVEVDADTAVAVAMIQAIDAETPDISVDVTAETDSAEATIAALTATPEVIELAVEVDTESAEASLGGLSTASDDAGESLDSAAVASTALGQAQGFATGSIDAGTNALGGMLSTAGPLGKVLAGGVVALGGFAVGAVNSLGATKRLTDTMGEFATIVEHIEVGNLSTDLSELAINTGSSGSAMKNAAADSFQMLTSFGVGEKAAAGYSAEVLALAGRAVALNPALGETGDVAKSLNAALLSGKDKALAPYALGLTSVEINAKASEIALADGRTEVTRTDKAMAGAALATEKFGHHLKQDIAEGAENPILQVRKLGKEFSSAATEIGKPLVVPLIDTLKAAKPSVEAIGQAFGSLAEATLPLLAEALGAVAPIIQVFADVLKEIPGPVLAIGAAFIGLRSTLGPVFAADGMIFQGAKGLSQLGASLKTTGGRLGFAAVGAATAAAGFQQIGASAEDSTGGIIQMAIGGASLGAAIGAMTPVTAAGGAAIGALAGAAVGGVTSLLSAGESLDEYRQKFEKLGSALEQLNAQQSFKKFAQQLGEDEWVELAGNNVNKFREEITALATTSPAAAEKVVKGFIAMREEVDKPLTTAQIRTLNDAVDQGSKAYARHVVEQKKSTAENTAASAAALANAQSVTNQAAVTQAAAEAQQHHTDALSQSTSAYQEVALAATAQAAADQNAIFAAQQAALASRSQADAASAVAQEHNTYVMAVDAANAAAARYAFGAGTAKEVTDATGLAVGILSQNLALLSGNYYSALGASLGLEAQELRFNETLNEQGGTLGDNALKVNASKTALEGMGLAANQASEAAARNNEGVYASLAPLVSYQTELENTKARLIETGDTGGAEFVQKLMDANKKAIDNLAASQGPFTNAASNAVGGAVTGARNQGGNFAGTTFGVGLQGVGGLGGGLGGAPDVASGAVNAAASAAGLAGANMHNIGYGIGTSFSEGMGDGIYANEGYVYGAAKDVAAAAIAGAHAGINNPPFPSREGIKIGKSFGAGMVYGLDASASDVFDASNALSAAMADAYSDYVPAIGTGGGNYRGGTGPTINFDITVNGVSDLAQARRVGEQVGNAASEALTRRGVVVTARLG